MKKRIKIRKTATVDTYAAGYDKGYGEGYNKAMADAEDVYEKRIENQEVQVAELTAALGNEKIKRKAYSKKYQRLYDKYMKLTTKEQRDSLLSIDTRIPLEPIEENPLKIKFDTLMQDYKKLKRNLRNETSTRRRGPNFYTQEDV